MYVAERVDETAAKEMGEARPLLVGETCGHMVRSRIGQIYLLVGYVVVAAGDDRFDRVEGPQIFSVFLIPDLPLGKASQSVSRIRCVDEIEEEIRELERDHAAFTVHRLGSTDLRIVRFDFQTFSVESHCAGISLSCRLAGADPGIVIVGEEFFQRSFLLRVHTCCGQLCLLYRNDVCSAFGNRRKYVAGQKSACAV